MDFAGDCWQLDSAFGVATPPPEIMQGPMDFLSRSWSASALEITKALSPHTTTAHAAAVTAVMEEDIAGEGEGDVDAEIIFGNPFAFACSVTSQLVMDRILSQPEAAQMTAGRLSHSSGPLNGGSLSDSPPASLSDRDHHVNHCGASTPAKPGYRGGRRTMGRWLKDRRERRKEVTRAHNAQLHAAVSVASVSAAVAAFAAAAAAASPSEDSYTARTNQAIASAATLVAAQCVEAAEALGADRGHLAASIDSAVGVRTPGDITTLTTAAATALRGAATVKAGVLKEMWNIAAVIPVEKGFTASHHHCGSHCGGEAGSSSGELIPDDNFLALCSQELLARGTELLKRTRKGAFHWKFVSVCIQRTGQVKLEMKSRHVAGTITKKKKNIVTEVCKNIAAWPERHLPEGGEERCYFGFKTAEERLIEFECRGQREYELTQGVSRICRTNPRALIPIVVNNYVPRYSQRGISNTFDFYSSRKSGDSLIIVLFPISVPIYR